MIIHLNINKVRGKGIRNEYTYRKKKGNTYNKILFTNLQNYIIHVNHFNSNQSIHHYDNRCIIYIIWSIPIDLI